MPTPPAPTPEMQVSPALPWAAGQSGEITLRNPLTAQDLANGALQITDSVGRILVPHLDGLEVYYTFDNSQDHVASIIFDDVTGETHLDIDTSLDLAVADIKLFSPLGELNTWTVKTLNGEQPPQDTECVFVLQTENDPNPVGILSQDGETCVKGVYNDGFGEDGYCRVTDNTSHVNITDSIVLSHVNKPTQGPLANLPLIPCHLEYDDDNRLVLTINYQPSTIPPQPVVNADAGTIYPTSNYDNDAYLTADF